jgi:hypothetical protein
MAFRVPGSSRDQKIAGFSLVGGMVIGVVAVLVLQQVHVSALWPGTPHEFIYFFGFLLLTIPAIALLGTTAAAVYAGLIHPCDKGFQYN